MTSTTSAATSADPAALPNPFAPEAKPDPYPVFARLRRESPVHPVPLPDGRRLWVVTRHDDVEAALRDPRLSERDPRVDDLPPPMSRFIRHRMLGQDPPDHTRLRRLVSQAFTPKLVASLEPRVQRIADALLDRVQLHGHLDLIDDYAHPLPLTVIAELLGIPDADHGPFRRWSHAAVANEIVAVADRRAEAMAEFADYLEALFDRKRRAPGADLVSGLVHAADGDDRLSGDELMAMVRLLIVAGHETTVNLIGNGLLALLRHPAQLRSLREDPALLPAAVEELLRYDGPVETSTPRFSTAEVPLPGGTVPAGEMVLVVLASANRDGARFRDPDVLDVHRADVRHLAFGKGIHYCLGAPLARLEGRVAIGTVLRRLPGLRPAVRLDALQWRPSLLMRGPRSFPVLFDRSPDRRCRCRHHPWCRPRPGRRPGCDRGAGSSTTRSHGLVPRRPLGAAGGGAERRARPARLAAHAACSSDDEIRAAVERHLDPAATPTRPVLIAHGGRSPERTRAYAETAGLLRDVLPAADLVELPGLGHAMPLEDPAAVADVIRTAVARGAAPAPA